VCDAWFPSVASCGEKLKNVRTRVNISEAAQKKTRRYYIPELHYSNRYNTTSHARDGREEQRRLRYAGVFIQGRHDANDARSRTRAC